MTLPFQALSCPLDGSPLQRIDGCWRCASGHSFDIAAQGYTHLLPVQHKRSLDPGDSKAMIQARQRFLAAGHYKPIADAVSQTVLARRSPHAPLHCLDAGCGEGFYLRALVGAACAQADERQREARTQADTIEPLSIVGVDISKWAIVAAARQDKQSTWLVASNANLPIQSGSLDVVLCMFGFPVYAEFARVLKPGGLLLQVDAGPDHLRELRSLIYPSLRPERTPSTVAPAGFRAHATEHVRAGLTLTRTDDIADLLVMTPHFYRASSEGRDRAAALTELNTTIDVVLTTFTSEPNGTPSHERL